MPPPMPGGDNAASPDGSLSRSLRCCAGGEDCAGAAAASHTERLAQAAVPPWQGTPGSLASIGSGFFIPILAAKSQHVSF